MNSIVKKSLYITVILSSLVLASCQSTSVNTSNNGTPQQSKSQFERIDQLIKNQQLAKAEQELNQIKFNELDQDKKIEYIMARSDLAIAAENGEQALFWLAGQFTPLFERLDVDNLNKIGLKRATAFELAGQYSAAARERIFLAPVLNEQQYGQNHEQIWFDLESESTEALTLFASQERTPNVSGWLQLALISRTTTGDLEELLETINLWIENNASHPAAIDLPGSLKILNEIANQRFEQIAVLIPLSDKFAKVGQAIQTGFLNKYYSSDADAVGNIKFYDSSATRNIQQLYMRAVEEGAQFVIGPISPDKVKDLQQLNNFPVPVLTLSEGDVSENSRQNLLQFDLSATQEANAVALQAMRDGLTQAAILAPDTSYGEKVTNAFALKYQALGGQIISNEYYAERTQFIKKIQNLLNITDSKQRAQNLKLLLGDDQIQFEARRRQDVDLIFMPALPKNAIQLKPTLNSQYGSDIPVYSLPLIYEGLQSNQNLSDLEGIRFQDKPWDLSTSENKQNFIDAFGKDFNQYGRFVSLGSDAHLIMRRYLQLQTYPETRLQGENGALRLESGGFIRSDQTWMQFENGKVVPYIPQVAEQTQQPTN